MTVLLEPITYGWLNLLQPCKEGGRVDVAIEQGGRIGGEAARWHINPTSALVSTADQLILHFACNETRR